MESHFGEAPQVQLKRTEIETKLAINTNMLEIVLVNIHDISALNIIENFIKIVLTWLAPIHVKNVFHKANFVIIEIRKDNRFLTCSA